MFCALEPEPNPISVPLKPFKVKRKKKKEAEPPKPFRVGDRARRWWRFVGNVPFVVHTPTPATCKREAPTV